MKTNLKDNLYLINKIKKDDLIFESGNGCYVKTIEGETFFDFTCANGFLPLGYTPATVGKTIAKLSKEFSFSPNTYYSPAKGVVATSLCKACQMDKVAFADNYKDAVELAVRIARRCYADTPNKHKVAIVGGLALNGGIPANVLTKNITKSSYKKLVPGGYIFTAYNDIDDLFTVLNDKSVCAVYFKSVQYIDGIYVKASASFVKALRELTEANNQILIWDENETIGHTGSFTSYKQFNVKPDIVCLGKSIAHGFPFGAVCCDKTIAESFDATGIDFSLRSNVFVCNVANAIVETMASPKFASSCNNLFTAIGKNIEKLNKQITVIKNISQSNNFIHIEFNNMLKPDEIKTAFIQHKILAYYPSPFEVVLTAPLTATAGDIGKAFKSLAKLCEGLKSKLRD